MSKKTVDTAFLGADIAQGKDLTGKYPWGNDDEFIWSADRARHVSKLYDSKILKQGLQEIMRYIKAAADAGNYACTVYDGIYNSQADIKLVADKLINLGYDVGLSSHYNEWHMVISWHENNDPAVVPNN